MKIVILKYNAGNVHSVYLALKRLGIEARITDQKEEIEAADKVIFPGVGEASSAMNYLRNRKLDSLLSGLKQPVLGICLGLQLMCKFSEENETDGLDIFPGLVRRFPDTMKVPHMGWNSISGLRGELFNGLSDGIYVYFVHSYYAEQNAFSTATCEYSVTFNAAMQKANYYAVQFHPEKSGEVGSEILINFIKL